MSLKRIILILLTLVTFLLCSSALYESWRKPQFNSRLQLYEANILLQAQEWRSQGENAENLEVIRQALLGLKPLDTAVEQYQDVRDSASKNLEEVKKIPKQQQEQSPAQIETLITELDLRLGILKAKQGEIDTAIKTWVALEQNSEIQPEIKQVAEVLTGLWSNPPRLLPNAQELIKTDLEGWFRYTVLSQLYDLQQRKSELSELKTSQQKIAEDVLWKLLIIGIIPRIAAIFGVGLLIFTLIQRLIKGKESWLAQNSDIPWSTPWNWEIILQVFVFGFFLMGQIIIPQLFSLLPIPRPAPNVRIQALYVLSSYLLVAIGAIGVLYISLKPFIPLPEGWFRISFKGKWFAWGLGGYCIALPVVVIVSLINQQIWQGQGGSNPLLEIALKSRDSVGIAIFFFTAGIAAPVFEEILFRGFLLPSLTRYLPGWTAIVTSSFIFAAAHLSLSEIIPLTALGSILGFVYSRERNLLAPILLHSLWNTGTLLSLVIVGSSINSYI
jgi:uncharacterized protein